MLKARLAVGNRGLTLSFEGPEFTFIEEVRAKIDSYRFIWRATTFIGNNY